jgi:hypothetical protein
LEDPAACPTGMFAADRRMDVNAVRRHARTVATMLDNDEKGCGLASLLGSLRTAYAPNRLPRPINEATGPAMSSAPAGAQAQDRPGIGRTLKPCPAPAGLFFCVPLPFARA